MIRFVLIALSCCMLFVGCGYKPKAQYAREVLGQNIYAEVIISRLDPKNTVLIKDAISEAIVSRLGGKLTTEEKADSKILVSVGGISFSPTVYDNKGYIIAYKTIVNLNIRYEKKDGKIERILTSGEYDFPIEANSVVSDSKRFNAIKYSSEDAINEFISKIAVRGMQNGKHD
ncbi:MAG: LPS assembly lipoprotein LptE [Sulfurospirillaceae bacterium]|nr:LPS assembly lipoprotein LptE [Sulfurospirillaceae bacterium]